MNGLLTCSHSSGQPSFSWCSSAKILLPGLVRFQQLHAGAITEPTHPFRKDCCEGRAPLVERGEFHLLSLEHGFITGLEEEKNTSLHIQHPTTVFKESGERHLVADFGTPWTKSRRVGNSFPRKLENVNMILPHKIYSGINIFG